MDLLMSNDMLTENKTINSSVFPAFSLLNQYTVEQLPEIDM